MPHSYELQLLGGIAGFLNDHELGSWDDFGATPYTEDTVRPIFIGPDMPTYPDECITLTPGVRSYMRADILTGVQIRLRGKKVDGTAGNDAVSTDVSDWAQQVMDVFYPNGFPLTATQFGSVRVGAVIPGDALPLSRDANGRFGYIQNFGFRGRRPRPE
jgi:hypothetical protein